MTQVRKKMTLGQDRIWQRSFLGQGKVKVSKLTPPCQDKHRRGDFNLISPNSVTPNSVYQIRPGGTSTSFARIVHYWGGGASFTAPNPHGRFDAAPGPPPAEPGIL